MKRHFILALILLWTAPAIAQDDPVPQSELDAIGERGRLVYEYDQAAWHTTDALLANVSRETVPTAGGWFVRPKESALEVVYYGLEEETPYLVGIFTYADGRAVATDVPDAGERRPVSADVERFIEIRRVAVEAAGAAQFERCSEANVNIVALPPNAERITSVYVMTPQPDHGVYPVGGHYRIDVGADGTVVSSRRFLNSCFAFDMAVGEGDNRPEAFMLTHLLDPVPTEIHVFASLASGLPIYVMTAQNEQIWRVTGDEIASIGSLDEPPGE